MLRIVSITQLNKLRFRNLTSSKKNERDFKGIEKMMEKIRDHYMRQVKTHRWGKIKAEAAKIEKKREVKRKQKAAAEKAEDS